MDYERAYKITINEDERTFVNRINRLSELDRIELNAEKNIPARLLMYVNEAHISYINGAFNSSIFCSIQAIDQIIRHEYVKLWRSDTSTLCRINEINDHVTFGQMKDLLKRIEVREKLSHILEKNQSLFNYDMLIKKLEKLNAIRNSAIVHPLYVDFPDEDDPNKTEKIDLIKRDLKNLLTLVGAPNGGVKATKVDAELSKMVVQDFDFENETILGFRESIADIYLRLIALYCYETMNELIWLFYRIDE